MKIENFSINIAWLYPDLMSTYGDRGNIIVLEKRLSWRGIKPVIKKIFISTPREELENCDLIFMGGAQDRQQEIVNRDLQKTKATTLKKMINQGIPGLFICGAYQFMGRYYKAADGTVISGLGLFDLYTESPGLTFKRLIGNIVVKLAQDGKKYIFTGFENHGGRTYLGKSAKPFAQVIKGYGNNGKDKTEGMIYKKAIGTYLHGPILPKNPELADWLIEKALERKYKKKIYLEKLDDRLENKAREFIINKL